MIKFENFENTEVVGWEAAIRGMSAKGYRQTKNGKPVDMSIIFTFHTIRNYIIRISHL